MPRRESKMTKEALLELERRHKAGEDMSGPFDLRTGKPIPMTPELRAINDELMRLEFK